jgi:hypothetical protein
MGFVLNPYNQYITNCIIEGKQCIIAWYVADTRISHKDPNVVTRIIQKLEQRFDKMTVTRGQEYVFLGMHIRYTNKGTAVITMKDYLTEAIEESGLDISKSVSTPASRTLFDVDKSAEPLGKKESEVFHSVSAKSLYVSLRARVDLLLPIVFRCTRVSNAQRRTRRSSSGSWSTSMGLWTLNTPSALTTSEGSAHGSIHLTPYILTCGVTPSAQYRLAAVESYASPPNKS